MTYKSKTQFTDKHNFRKAGKMMIDNVAKSPRAVQESFTFYKSVAKQIGWIK